MEQFLPGRFMSESTSLDGKEQRWEFLLGTYHGLPLICDMPAFATTNEATAAATAALAEAREIYRWLGSPDNSKANMSRKVPTTQP
jgi:hypothetical protein